MEKKYVNEIIVKEKTFDNGGSLLRVSVKVPELIETLNQLLFLLKNFLARLDCQKTDSAKIYVQDQSE